MPSEASDAHMQEAQQQQIDPALLQLRALGFTSNQQMLAAIQQLHQVQAVAKLSDDERLINVIDTQTDALLDIQREVDKLYYKGLLKSLKSVRDEMRRQGIALPDVNSLVLGDNEKPSESHNHFILKSIMDHLGQACAKYKVATEANKGDDLDKQLLPKRIPLLKRYSKALGVVKTKKMIDLRGTLKSKAQVAEEEAADLLADPDNT